MRTFIASLAILSTAQGFAPSMIGGQHSTSLCATNEQSRAGFLQTLTGTAAVAAFSTLSSPLVANAEGETIKLPSGTSYDIIKSGEGPKPTVGELAAVRFKAEVKQNVRV